MSKLRRIVLLRHGDTVGESRIRFHGAGDVPLSEEGRDQMRAAGARLRGEVFDVVVASPLRRAWEGARIASGGAAVRLESRFREIHFGLWEGMTAGEIEAADPSGYQAWQAKQPGFEFPSGERRADFEARVLAGLADLQANGAANVLAVVHKGVVRTIAKELLGEALEEGLPELGEAVGLSRGADGRWFEGRRGSDPEGL